MAGLVDGHERNVSGSVTGRPDIPSLGLVGRDEGGGGRVQEGGLVSRLELVDPVLTVSHDQLYARTRRETNPTDLVTDKVAHEVVDSSVDQDSDTILDDGNQQVGRSVHDVGLETIVRPTSSAFGMLIA